MKDKFLILGSQGFVGRHLVNFLLKKNFFIISIGKKKNFFKNKNLKHIKTDVYKSENYQKYLKENSILIFLSASKFHFKDVKKFKNLINIFKKKKVKRFLFLSSASVYGNNNNINSELVAKRPINKQGKFFIKFEKTIINSFKYSNINYIVLRTFNIFGNLRKKRGMIENFIYKLIHNHKNFKASGLDNLRSYISINDVIKIIFKLSTFKHNLIINLSNPYFIFSLKDISKKIYSITKKKFKRIIIRKNKSVIKNSVCKPYRLQNLHLLKFSKNFNFELSKIIKEYNYKWTLPSE